MKKAEPPIHARYRSFSDLMVSYRPLFTCIEALAGKELTDEQKELIITLAEKGANW